MPRVTPNYDPQQPTLTPAQQVAGNPYVPKLKEPTLLPVKEFAELSGVVADLTVQQAQKQNAIEQQAGEQDYVDELAQAHKEMDAVEGDKTKNQSDFLKAEKTGTITPAQNPWRKVGYNQAAARDIMSQYQSDLIVASSKATSVRDANGNLVPATPPEQVAQEVWAKYAGNPLLRTFEGSKVATQQKIAIDAAFRQDAAQSLAKNQAVETQRNLDNTVGQWMTTHGLSQDVTPDSIDHLDQLINDGRLHGADQYQALKSGMDLALASFNGADTGHGQVSSAADVLRRFTNVKVGNTTVGKDAELGPYLQNLIQRADAEHEQKYSQAVANVTRRRALKYDSEEHNVLTMIAGLRDQNATPGDIDMAIKARQAEIRQKSLYTDESGDDSVEVADHLTKFAAGILAEGSDDAVRQLTLTMNAGEESGTIRQRLNDALEHREINTAQFEHLSEQLDRHANVLPILRGETVGTFNAQLAVAAKLPGLPEGAGIQFGRDQTDKIAKVNQELAKYARGNSKLPEEQQQALIDEWTAKRLPQLQSEFQANTEKFRTERLQKHQAAGAALASGKPIPAGVLDPEHFSENEIVQWQEKQEQVAARDRYVEHPSVVQVGNVMLEAELKKQEAEYKGTEVPPDRKAELVNRFNASWRQRVREFAESVQATSTPGESMNKFLDGIYDVGQSFAKRSQQYGVPGYHPNQPIGAEAPTGTQEKGNIIDATNQIDADALFKAPDGATFATRATAKRDPLIAPGAYDTIQSALTRSRRGYFNLVSPATMTDARERARSEVDDLNDRTDLSPDAKRKAALTLVGPLGVDPDEALAGKFSVRHPPELVDAMVGKLRGIRDEQSKLGPAFRDNLALGYARTLQRKLDAVGAWHAQPNVEFPLTLGDINPYTTPMFRDTAQVDEWQHVRAADMRELAAKYGVPNDQYERWIGDQRTLARRNLNGR